MRINLTLAGFGGRNSGRSTPVATTIASSSTPAAAPPPPPAAAPVAPPTPKKKRAEMAATRRGGENIRNVGGGRGQDVASAMRALKGLTGQ